MLAPSPSQHCDPIRYGPVSLWEMINFSLYGFVWALKLLEVRGRPLPTKALLTTSTFQYGRKTSIVFARISKME